MESVITEFFSKIIKEFVEHIFAYLGIAAGTVAAGTYIFKLYYKKSITNTKSVQQNTGATTAADDVVNGNQMLINNHYYGSAEPKGLAKTTAPSEMVDEVEQLPTSELEEAKKDLVGQHFQWQVKFLKLKEKGKEDEFRVFFTDPHEFGKPMIYCDLRLKEHPGLASLSEGESLNVAGKLNCFSGREVKLDLEEVIYSKP